MDGKQVEGAVALMDFNFGRRLAQCRLSRGAGHHLYRARLHRVLGGGKEVPHHAARPAEVLGQSPSWSALAPPVGHRRRADAPPGVPHGLGAASRLEYPRHDPRIRSLAKRRRDRAGGVLRRHVGRTGPSPGCRAGLQHYSVVRAGALFSRESASAHDRLSRHFGPPLGLARGR